MKPQRCLLALVLTGVLARGADAALLHMQFAGGASEVTLALSGSVRIDVLWTMQTTDTPKSLLTGVDLRFHVNDVPDPDGSTQHDKFVVTSMSTAVPTWTTAATNGVGSFFSEGNFFLSAGDPMGDFGVTGNGTVFTTVVASFVLHKANFQPGDTYITFRHEEPGDVLPAAYDGPVDWLHRWQTNVTGPREYDMGLGNPGDGGAQWAYHGLETFQPLIIHNHLPEPGMFLLITAALAGVVSRRRARNGEHRAI